MTAPKPVALVTGASRGIGRAIAVAFGRGGYQVAVNFATQRAKAEETVKLVQSAGGEAQAFQADVSDPRQAAKLVEDVSAKFGRLDALVNNAGVTRDRTILKMSDQEWNEVVAANLSGPFWCLREAAKVMMRQKDGAVVNIGSIIGLRGSIGNANYAASKAGLVGLTKAAARELGRFNIRVNAVLPGFHRTAMGDQVWEKVHATVLAEHVLGRLTDLDELARFVAFLCRQKSASGQVYNFDSRIL